MTADDIIEAKVHIIDALLMDKDPTEGWTTEYLSELINESIRNAGTLPTERHAKVLRSAFVRELRERKMLP